MSNLIFILYPVSCVFLPCILYLLIQHFGFHQKTTIPHLFWVFIFLYYIYLIFETTGIGTIWELGMYLGMYWSQEINLIPFRDGFTIGMFLNIVMFMPLGFLLPLIWKEYDNLLRTTITGFFFSIGIELCQLLNRRATDIDDLIMNTLGAMIGWGIWKGFSQLIHLKYARRNQGCGTFEAVSYLLLATAGQFFLYNWRWMIQITA